MSTGVTLYHIQHEVETSLYSVPENALRADNHTHWHTIALTCAGSSDNYNEASTLPRPCQTRSWPPNKDTTIPPPPCVYGGGQYCLYVLCEKRGGGDHSVCMLGGGGTLLCVHGSRVPRVLVGRVPRVLVGVPCPTWWHLPLVLGWQVWLGLDRDHATTHTPALWNREQGDWYNRTIT